MSIKPEYFPNFFKLTVNFEDFLDTTFVNCYTFNNEVQGNAINLFKWNFIKIKWILIYKK